MDGRTKSLSCSTTGNAFVYCAEYVGATNTDQRGRDPRQRPYLAQKKRQSPMLFIPSWCRNSRNCVRALAAADVCKDGCPAALLFKIVALDKNRIASVTAMPKVIHIRQLLCSSSKYAVHVENHQLHTISFRLSELNCDDANDAKATWQRRRGSSRSQQLRNGICIFRWCQPSQDSDGSLKKNSSFNAGFVPWSRSRSETCVFAGAQDLIRRRPSSHDTYLFASPSKRVRAGSGQKTTDHAIVNG